MKKVSVFVTLFMVVISSTAWSGILRVGHEAGYDFNTITDALNTAVEGDTVTVAAGVYKHYHPQYSETFPLTMKAGVILTRESSDILPVIDCENIAQIMRCENIAPAPETRIEGFKFRRGMAYSPETDGAGIYIDSSTISINDCEIEDCRAISKGGGLLCVYTSLSLNRCRFESNEADKGGGLYCDYFSTLVMNECEFINNTVSKTGGGIHVTIHSEILGTQCEILNNSASDLGGGLYGNSATVQLINCLIDSNSTESNGGGGYFKDSTINMIQTTISKNSGVKAGGLAIRESSLGCLIECDIQENSSSDNAGGIESFHSETNLLQCAIIGNSSGFIGGGMLSNNSDTVLAHCHIKGNTAESGGGLNCEDSTQYVYNCMFNDNTAEEFGGALGCRNSYAKYANCTFTENNAWDGGGCLYSLNSDPEFINCILWNNTISEINLNSSSPQFTYCNVKGGWPGEGNYNANPLFASGPDGDYYLSHVSGGQLQNSPCIDAGSDIAVKLSFDICDQVFYMDKLTSNTNEILDSGMVDTGYHYDPKRDPCLNLGCTIDMPSHDFESGDQCYCHINICNPDRLVYKEIPVFVILDIFGEYFFAPGFHDFDYYVKTIHAGETTHQILPTFTWPSNAGKASGIIWYAGMTNHGMTEVFGEMDAFVFGWH